MQHCITTNQCTWTNHFALLWAVWAVQGHTPSTGLVSKSATQTADPGALPLMSTSLTSSNTCKPQCEALTIHFALSRAVWATPVHKPRTGCISKPAAKQQRPKATTDECQPPLLVPFTTQNRSTLQTSENKGLGLNPAQTV